MSKNSTFQILYDIILSRKNADAQSSWTAHLLSCGPEKCAEKFGEEAIEAIIEAVKGDKERLISESADALYHLFVMLVSRGVTLEDIEQELNKRQGRSGIDEKSSRTR